LARAWRFRKRGGRVNLGTGEGRCSRRPDAGGWREDHAPAAHSDSFGDVPTQGLHFVVRRQAGMGEMNMGERLVAFVPKAHFSEDIGLGCS
jgi:hypothetical protein